ncbi:MAG: SPOR domain-containing protein [Candidatus Cloacimonetes bacterium]|nr:SPOR domain-containing protein [Candidatus Cloacimonadota bacterium]
MRNARLIILILGLMIIFQGCSKSKFEITDKVSSTRKTSVVKLNDLKETVKSDLVKNAIKKLNEPNSFVAVSKNFPTQKDSVSQIEEITLKDTVQMPVGYNEKRSYVIQLSCIKDKARLEREQQNLKQSGYESVISSKKRNGILYHRLRMKGSYTENEAVRIGEEVKNRFLNITDYLVLRSN